MQVYILVILNAAFATSVTCEDAEYLPYLEGCYFALSDNVDNYDQTASNMHIAGMGSMTVITTMEQQTFIESITE